MGEAPRTRPLAETGAARPEEAGGGWWLVGALSAAQLVSWGTVYLSFSLFAVPMETALSWNRTMLNGASLPYLLTSGLAAYLVGSWIDQCGGRAIMSLGSALLAAWSRVARHTGAGSE